MQKATLIKLVMLVVSACSWINFSAQEAPHFKAPLPLLFTIKPPEFITTFPVGFISETQNQISFFKLSNTEKLPVLCRMEDKLCRQLNIWIKLRTGSDEYYRTLIALPHEKKSKLID